MLPVTPGGAHAIFPSTHAALTRGHAKHQPRTQGGGMMYVTSKSLLLTAQTGKQTLTTANPARVDHLAFRRPAFPRQTCQARCRWWQPIFRTFRSHASFCTFFRADKLANRRVHTSTPPRGRDAPRTYQRRPDFEPAACPWKIPILAKRPCTNLVTFPHTLRTHT